MPNDIDFGRAWNVFKVNIGEYPIDERCFTVKLHSELMADSAVGAVTADEPGGFCNFLAPVGVTQGRYNFVVGCGELGQFDRALDFYSQTVQELIEYTLRIALRNHKAIGICRRQSLEGDVGD